MALRGGNTAAKQEAKEFKMLMSMEWSVRVLKLAHNQLSIIPENNNIWTSQLVSSNMLTFHFIYLLYVYFILFQMLNQCLFINLTFTIHIYRYKNVGVILQLWSAVMVVFVSIMWMKVVMFGANSCCYRVFGYYLQRKVSIHLLVGV